LVGVGPGSYSSRNSGSFPEVMGVLFSAFELEVVRICFDENGTMRLWLHLDPSVLVRQLKRCEDSGIEGLHSETGIEGRTDGGKDLRNYGLVVGKKGSICG
jgi:hypothetical protein